MNLELRVLFGPQAGSRLPLALGEYVLGCSDECDIVLIGPNVRERHAVLVVDQDGVRLKPESGSSVVDAVGNPVSEEVALSPGMPLELGGISVAVDDVDAPWPEARTVAPLTAQPAAAAAAPAPAEAPPPQAETSAAGQSAPSEKAPPASDRWLRLVRGPGGVTAAVAAVACFSFALAAWYDSTASEAMAQEPVVGEVHDVVTPVSTQPPSELVDAVEASGSGQTLEMRRRDDGGWAVTGYLQNQAQLTGLQRATAAVDPPVEFDVYVDELLVARANEVLQAAEGADFAVGAARLTVESSERGVLRLSGSARDGRTVDAAKLAILNAVPGVREIEGSALLPGQLLVKLRESIEAAGLGGRVAFVQEAPEVIVTASLNATERARWSEIQSEFAKTYGNVLPIRSILAEARPRVPFQVRTVVGGGVPFIMTRDGVRVIRGSDLHGHRLTAVLDSEVVFDGAERWRISR